MAWAQVEEIVTAEGMVEPAGRIKIINHAQGGKVAKLAGREMDNLFARAIC